MFIAIDGPDGAGKTTLAKSLVDKLQSNGYKAILTTEPTDTPLGKQIRKELKSGCIQTNPDKFLKLFVTDRDVHIKAFIEPYIADDIIVITDRYKYSTVCYQSLQGIDLEKLILLNRDFKVPDVSFILCVDDVTSLVNRIQARKRETDFFETKEILEKCCEIYKKMPQYFPNENFKMINANLSENEVAENVYNYICSMLK